jgi:acetylornithine deacetylase/succinyl-diaminopimelate desuccinylase-like protein
MSRDAAIANVRRTFDSGAFKATLARRIAVPTESQNPGSAPALDEYVRKCMAPDLEKLGFTCKILSVEGAKGPFLIAERMEDPALVTVLGYGHGDTVLGMEGRWIDNLSPWRLTERDGRWYGRGVVDNKGQHSINLAALEAVIAARGGKLGFNARYLIEMGEETGSPGLPELARRHGDLLAADVLIGSDGPRIHPNRPDLSLGTRGAMNFDLSIEAREGGHHSGNWGGLLSDPGIELAHAIASIVGPTGQIRIPEWVPPELPANVRRVLQGVEPGGDEGLPEIDRHWGEAGLTPAERVYGWCSFSTLAYTCGTPEAPVNAIPPRAWARCQLRFVVGIDPADIIPALRRHLKRYGFEKVVVEASRESLFKATRLDPDHPWVRFVASSLERSGGKAPTIIPNAGGSLPNDVFTETLGLPTIWIPHSYGGCSQHAPNEHVPIWLVREALELMAGLYYDIGEGGHPGKRVSE